MGNESRRIALRIDGREVEARAGKTVLEASLEAGIYIPHLCSHPDLSPVGGCRLCTVEIQGVDAPVTACTTPASDGMVVTTKTDRVDRMRRLAMELLLAAHPQGCDTCDKYLNCELQSLKQYLINSDLRVRTRSKLLPTNTKNPLFQHDPNKCVACGRCVRACLELRGVGVLEYRRKDHETYCGTGSDLPLADSGCRFCGACAEVCPTGAIADKAEFTKGKKRRAALVPCRYACPAEIDVPRYLRFIREKDYTAAVAVIREKVPFPRVLGYACDRPCEGVCRRGEVNQPISIRELKRFASGNGSRNPGDLKTDRSPPTGKRVAVVGSGPAGLTAAYYLARQGHEVTVFESLPLAGGMLRYGIPEYHLPRHVLDAEIKDIEAMGVEVRVGTRLEEIDALFGQGYDAVVVAVGTHVGQRLAIPGADSRGVTTSIDFLRDVNLGKEAIAGDKVVVLGGGGVALDCARVARRLGAREVHVVCLESRPDMPAAPDQVEQGEEEGVLIHPARTSTRILTEDGRVTGVEFLEVASFLFDEDKRAQIQVRENSEHVVEADSVIFAVGQRPEIPAGFGLDLSPKHLVEMDPYTLNTSRDGVFAAGDAVSGTASIIKAIASGRKAAIAVDRFLGGSGDIDERLAPVTEPEKCLARVQGFAAMGRAGARCVPAPERLLSFCEVEDAMDETGAEYESGRCMQCDLRLQITPVKFWGSY